MQDFFNKLSKTAATAANRAGNKAGEMIEVGKLKSRISSAKQDIGMAEKEIGKYCYKLYCEDKLEDSSITEICDKITGYREEIAKLEAQIQDTKDEYQSKNEDDAPTL